MAFTNDPALGPIPKIFVVTLKLDLEGVGGSKTTDIPPPPLPPQAVSVVDSIVASAVFFSQPCFITWCRL